MAKKKKKSVEENNADAPMVSAALARAFANVSGDEAHVTTDTGIETTDAVETAASVETSDSVETTDTVVETPEIIVAALEASEGSAEISAESAPTEGHHEMSETEIAREAAPGEAIVAIATEADGTVVTDSLKITDFGEIEQAVEALVFASTRPLSLQRMKNALNHFNYDLSQLPDVLKSLEQKYESTGFQFVKVGGGYQLRSHPKQADLLQRILEDKPAKLGTSALEVLAIVAYKQPVTRSEIDAVRGIDSGHLMKGLMEKNLIRTQGHAETPGRPMIYGTTPYFLEVFSLHSLDDLPAVDEFVRELGPDSDTEGGERLNVLAAEPDRGTFDEPAEDRFETPDFGGEEPNEPAGDAAPPEAQA